MMPPPSPSTPPAQLHRALAHAFEQFAVSLRPFIAGMHQAARCVHASMWRAYRAVGCPHGETEEGLLRWMREHAEREHVRAQAERETSIAETVALLRARQL